MLEVNEIRRESRKNNGCGSYLCTVGYIRTMQKPEVSTHACTHQHHYRHAQGITEQGHILARQKLSGRVWPKS